MCVAHDTPCALTYCNQYSHRPKMYKKQISENKIEGDTEDLRPYKAQTGQETYKSRKIREEKLKKTCSKEEID